MIFMMYNQNTNIKERYYEKKNGIWLDNRNNSTDSRIIGSIKKKDIVGRAWLRMYPFSEFGLVEKIE